MSQRGDWAYLTDGKPVYIPDHRIERHNAAYVYEPLRGYGHILAVFLDDKCIGWIETYTLGHGSVTEWVAAQRKRSKRRRS
jgi:hypothetical protein